MEIDEGTFVKVTDSQVEQREQEQAQALADLIANLNQQQREIVLAPAQDMMVIAGAGTGKTHVVISRIANLLSARQVRPREILAVTFTNKAAQEMADRICSFLGWQDPHHMEISTFHSFCYRMLSRYATEAMLPKNFTLLTPSSQESLLQHFLKEQNVAFSKGRRRSEDAIMVRDVVGFIDRQKDEMIKPNIDESKLDYYLHHLKEAVDLLNIKQDTKQIYEVLYACYEHLRISAGAVDFADLINYMVVLLRNNQEIRERLQKRFRYIFVDEFQDTNGTQYELLMQLKGPDNHVCVVGDDDQSIYEWRGAKIANVQRLLKDLPHLNIYALTINYRSTRNVLNFANALICFNNSRLIDKFLVNPLTYEGLCNCEKGALQYLFSNAQTDSLLLGRLLADELLSQYVDKDLSTLGEQERESIFKRANDFKMLSPKLVDHWEALRWGNINKRLNLLLQQQQEAAAKSDSSSSSSSGSGSSSSSKSKKAEAAGKKVNMNTLLWQAFPAEWINRYQAAHKDVPLVQLIEHDLYGSSTEGSCVYSLIKYLHETEGVPFDQIAILYRKNSLSAMVEDTLVENKVPYQIYGGLKFYERAEILSVLAYLRLVLNPRDDLSFNRVVNLPRRGIGDVTLGKLSAYAASCGVTQYEALAQLANAPAAAQRPFKKLLGFYAEMEECRALLKTLKLSEFVEQIVQRMQLLPYYKEIDKKDNMALVGQSRVDNILQFVDNAKRFEQAWGTDEASLLKQMLSEDEEMAETETPATIEAVARAAAIAAAAAKAKTDTTDTTQALVETMLRAFIDQSCLSSGAELNQEGGTQGSGVQLMTIHAAKGLEFTAVIVMGCEYGIMPSPLSENEEEERRLAYVAFTRAKRYLFACYARMRYSHMDYGFENTGPSEFLRDIKQSFTQHNVKTIDKGLPFEQRQFSYNYQPK